MTRPTLDNWMLPGNTFWSFRHVRELIPTAQVDCAAITSSAQQEDQFRTW
jgi:hypothetical protein